MNAGADERVVDARGLLCPAPVIRLAAAAREEPAGAVLRVLWTDPAARYDIPAWARMRGHNVLGTTPLETAEGEDTPAANETRVQLAITSDE